MDFQYTFAIIGGDKRQRVVADFLLSKGAKIIAYGADIDKKQGVSFAESGVCAAELADIIVLPLPSFTEDLKIRNSGGVSFSELAQAAPSALFMAGIAQPAESEAASRGIKLIDYYENKKLLLRNAIATAEAAVMLAISGRERTLMGSRILITGYGRIAKQLSKILSEFGACVTVAVRSDSQKREAAQYSSVKDIYDMDEILSSQDIIFNTVPSPVLSKKQLDLISDQALLIELASATFGIDLAYAKEKGLNVNLAQSLPGKISPASAGEAIGEAIFDILKERYGR